MSRLGSCPFCGGEARTAHDGCKRWWVRCRECLASTKECFSECEAIDIWNGRVDHEVSVRCNESAAVLLQGVIRDMVQDMNSGDDWSVTVRNVSTRTTRAWEMRGSESFDVGRIMVDGIALERWREEHEKSAEGLTEER